MRLLLQLMTDFPTLLHTSTSEIPTLLYTWSLKKESFRAEPRRTGHYREYPPTSVNPNTTESAELINYQTVQLTFL